MVAAMAFRGSVVVVLSIDSLDFLDICRIMETGAEYRAGTGSGRCGAGVRLRLDVDAPGS